jgi:periplasmic divalent cation tolerance protein
MRVAIGLEYCQVTTTLPDRATADRVAATLVEERWAACAQVVGPVESTYRRQGTVERATEWYCHLKTTLARAPGLRARLRELHPYDTPEIVAVPLVDGDPDYLAWVAASVGDRGA